MANIIDEIYTVRNLLDEAVEKQDENILAKAQKKFNNIFTKEMHLKTMATSTIDYLAESVEDVVKDREQNFAMIAFDFSKNVKRARGKDIPVEYFQFSSILEVVWYSCWMFNDLMDSLESNINQEVNQQIFDAIETNLRESLRIYEYFKDNQSIAERESLKKIYIEFKVKYREALDDQKLRSKNENKI